MRVGSPSVDTKRPRPLSTYDQKGKAPPEINGPITREECSYWGTAFYAGDRGVSINKELALRWFLKAAQLGDIDAQVTVSALYLSGDGVQRDEAEAERWGLMALEGGSLVAPFALVGMLTGEGASGTRSKRIFSAFERASEAGNANAQVILAAALQDGTLLQKDLNGAIRLAKAAAERGNSAARSMLSTLAPISPPDISTPLDAEECLRWARALHSGSGGVKFSPEEARSWFRKAADQGTPEAQLAYSVVLGDASEAFAWAMLAADQQHPPAYTQVGFYYERGYGVPHSYAEAFNYFLRASVLGDPQAKFKIGQYFEQGWGVASNPVEAYGFYSIAADDGFTPAPSARDRVADQHLKGAQVLAGLQRARELKGELKSGQYAGPAGHALRSVMPSVRDSARAAKPLVMPRASGTGAIVSRGGYVLTAAHVVATANTVRVVTPLGVKAAQIVRIDESNDLAVLKIADGSYLPLPVSPSGRVRLGQAVATIGFPNIEIQGFSPKVTRGEISSSNGIGDDPRSWQISVPVQSGNSGGPLLDESGNLIGIVVSKLGLKAAAATGDLPQNVNYAVKIAYALPLLEPYLETNAPEPFSINQKRPFEDMVASAQQSVVLILVY